MTNCCDAWGRCTRGQDCPIRDLPQNASVRWWSTGCCNSADCADLHCPGRPAARPATRAATPLSRCELLGVCQGHEPACEGCSTAPVTVNSDASSTHGNQPWDWLDRMRPATLWALFVGCSLAAAALTALHFAR